MRPPTIPTTIPVNRDDSKQVVIMKTLYNTLIEYRENKTHRILIQLFMCLPSRKDFPDYFNLISKPIAMNKIRERIERQQYADEEACMEDFKLMFSNCKFFNEDDSQIYQDAKLLEALLRERLEQLRTEYNRPSRDSKEAIILNVPNNNSTTNNISSPSTRSERLINSTSNHANNHSISANSNSTPVKGSNNNNSKFADDVKKDNTTNNSSKTHITSSSNSGNNINNAPSNLLTSTTNHDSIPSTPKSSNNLNNNNNNGIDSNTQQSDSTNHSTADQHNGNDELESNSIKVNHNHHNEASMDSSSNLSADLLASTPVEKCSLNTRRGRNSDAPKRQLLTGYIIYASEIRKQVIDKNPNQNFGDISRLVGNEWKALDHETRSKYDQRALIHNKRVRERAQRELHAAEGRLTNGLHTPKLTKRKLAKMAKEQMRQHHLSIAGHDDSSIQSPRLGHEHPNSTVSQTPTSNYKQLHHQHSSQPSQANASKTTTTANSSTQTNAIRFVEPPTKKRLVYSETFKKYIESLQVPNKDLLVEETTPDCPPELPTHWLGAGIGRHESAEAALWALRDFMLQDAVTMRRSMEPYLRH